MRKANLAELILSLVTSRERAVSMTGDLIEENQGHGAWRFCFYVVQTALSQLWRQISAAPFGMAPAAILGLLAEFGFLVAACVVFMTLLLIGISIGKVSFHADLPAWVDPFLGYVLTNFLVPFQVGVWMSRRYPGRELAGGLTLATVHAAINLCAGMLCWVAALGGGEAHFDVSFSQIHFVDWNGNISAMLTAIALYFTLYPAMLLAGAAWTRARTVAPPK